MSRRLLVAPVTVILTACSGSPYYQMPPEAARDRIAFYVAQVLTNRPLAGLAVAVVRDTAVVFAGGFGTRRLGDSTARVGENTVFHAGAIARAFTAAATLRLAAQGRLDLDAPLVNYVPYFRLADGRQNQVTARSLLSHSSGLPDIPASERDPGDSDGAALERFTRSLSDQRLAVDSVGVRYHFSRAGYVVLGDLLAKVGGAPYESVVTREVIAPLGLARTAFARPAADYALAHRGVLYHESFEPPAGDRAQAPASGLWSSVHDLAHFARALLHDGFLPDSLRALLWQAHVTVDTDVQMGLGWTVRHHGRNRVTVVEGATPGYGALVAVLPEHGIALALLANHDPQTPREMLELATGLLDLGEGRPPRPPQLSVTVPLAAVLARRNVAAAAGTFAALRSQPGAYAIEPDAIVALGDEVRRAGRTADAVWIYQLAGESHPEYFGTYRALALAYLDLADTLSAAEHYRTMLLVAPERQGCPAACYRDSRLEQILRSR